MTDKDSTAFMYPQFLCYFIEAYKNYPCLWKINSAEYKDRSKRDEALNHLLAITQETIPSADLKFLRTKIDSIKYSFRREHRKVMDSIKSGAAEESVYVPRLWYYNSLTFLVDHETHNPSTSNLDEEAQQVETSVEDDSEDEHQTQEESQVLDRPQISGNTMRPLTKRKRVDPGETPKVSKAILSSEKEDDEHDIFGKLVAAKLRRMSPNQGLHAEKLVTEVLYAGLQNKLTDKSSLRLNLQ